MVTLDQIRPGGGAVIHSLQLRPTLEKRLKDFGMVPGTRVRCRYRSPGGQVTALECRGAVIALRTWELRNIQVGLC